jgi:hypothetical protein
MNFANECITTFRHLELADQSLSKEIEYMIATVRNYYDWQFVSAEWVNLF